ncbi:MAG: hypothetical protein MI867_05250 [Pseudomonadales bacterium]|nr:hypothetical protein [Pseudomonadales bacterium]
MFKNKHILAALIIAPILSIISYFAVDHVVSERPHKAMQGAAYELVPKPNCRYQSGVCEMKNGNFEIKLHVDRLENGELAMRLSSEHPLKGVGISISNNEKIATHPSSMKPIDNSYQQWAVTISAPTTENQATNKLRLALTANESFYYAESGLAFVDYETTYDRDFR